jgi:hypothetical protein
MEKSSKSLTDADNLVNKSVSQNLFFHGLFGLGAMMAYVVVAKEISVARLKRMRVKRDFS